MVELSTRKRQGESGGRRWSFLPRMVMTFFVSFWHHSLANAKELIATNEWQKVGPNETLPAGLEIRMDLKNGGK